MSISFFIPSQKEDSLLSKLEQINYFLKQQGLNKIELAYDVKRDYIENLAEEYLLTVSLGQMESIENGITYDFLYDVTGRYRSGNSLNDMVKIAYALASLENSFIYNDNGLLDLQEIYTPEEIKKFIVD